MTDLIALAKQAGGSAYSFEYPSELAFTTIQLRIFADLIAAREREACALLVENQEAHATIWDGAAAIRARTTT